MRLDVRPEDLVCEGQGGERDVIQVLALVGRDNQEVTVTGTSSDRNSGQRDRNSSSPSRISWTKRSDSLLPVAARAAAA